MKQRKEKYKFVPGLNLYRKRDKTLNGGKPIYGKTVRELDAKIKLLHKEAEEKAAREEEEAEREKKPTFASYAAKWEMLYSPHVRPQTADDYHTAIENHILPTLGGMALAEITSDDVSEALLMVSHLSKSRLIAAGIDPKTVQYLAGHKSARTTMDLYAKVLYDRPEHLIPMVERAFEPQGGKTDAP